MIRRDENQRDRDINIKKEIMEIITREENGIESEKGRPQPQE